jgi:hypothetical protein
MKMLMANLNTCRITLAFKSGWVRVCFVEKDFTLGLSFGTILCPKTSRRRPERSLMGHEGILHQHSKVDVVRVCFVEKHFSFRVKLKIRDYPWP